eukprot:TRINITY_DN21459_c0_g1_i1.p1 TRINITY_DN21459_c0_g1~~TRINITY_DN21459_c0_g1_i1.p1  ORF type:complete len:218 (-),score=49.33 TRINITY_DN21459_c0_g1_i1:48-680(-)
MSSCTGQATQNAITLKGSTEIVAEFFDYSINSILFQRGLYPPDTFTRVTNYGLSMMKTKDEGLKRYITRIMEHIRDWLMQKNLQKLVMVISSVDTGTVLERWVFNIEADSPPNENANPGGSQTKSPKDIAKEIRAIIYQITSSVTFLPLLEGPCTFDLLVYADADAAVPQEWEESDPRYITKSKDVRLRSFSTHIHKVETMVAFKADDDE